MTNDTKLPFDKETLDPEDWGMLSKIGRRMLDDMLEYLKNIRSTSTRVPTEEAIKEICVPLSDHGDGEDKVYEVFRQAILPHTMTITNPRFWGLVAGTGSAYGMLAEMARAGMNGAQEFSFSEAHVNGQVMNWIKELLGFPEGASSVLVGGGSEANFTGLAVARNAKAEVDVKTKGVQALKKRMTLYCGDETHHCLERSVELLGLGNEALRRIPTDSACKIKIDSLKDAIEEDRSRGENPFCIIGCAGTTNTGAFDDLNVLADLAKQEDMWFHVDGAFGAWVKLSKTHRHLVDGLERADSLAVDLHKWMNMPYMIGCTIVKDRLAHYRTFVYGHEAKYLTSAFQISEDQLINPHNLSLALSRNFSSLKAYMLLRVYGKKKYANLVQKNLDQISYLAELIDADPELELTAPVVSNVACFRFNPGKLEEVELERLNRQILDDINKDAFMMISDTNIKGRYMLRACNVNHRSEKGDFDFLVDLVKKLGRKNLLSI